MVQLTDKNGKSLFLGAFVRVLRLPDSIEFGEFEANRQSSIGRISVIRQISKQNTGVFWYDDGEIKLEYRMITRDGVSSMSIGAFELDLEVVEPTKELEMLYNENLWSFINEFGNKQNSAYFKSLVFTFGYSIS